MEFQLASKGEVEQLRQWLREHPERVNIPSSSSNMTLLYTAILSAKGIDLASLQAGTSRYLNTVRMLCEEYHADVQAPNGGSGSTALHLAAKIGLRDLVQYFVEYLAVPVDRRNAFGATALDVARQARNEDCVATLQRATTSTAAAAGAAIAPANATPAASPPSRFANLVMTDDAAPGPILTGQRRQVSTSRFQSLAVSDSDDDGEHAHDTIAVNTTAPDSGSATLSSMVTPFNGNSAGGFSSGTSMNAIRGNGSGSAVLSATPSLPSAGAADGPSGPPQQLHQQQSQAVRPNCTPPVRPRKEFDITDRRVLSNPDLQGFRSAYGDGFCYTQCSDHYEIRGLLPYPYRNNVYYTPIIISVYAPASAADAQSDAVSPLLPCSPSDPLVNTRHSSPGGSPQLRTAPEGEMKGGPPAVSLVYCRFRVCLDLSRLNGYAVSRKAEYLDPVGGAVIPAPGDDRYETLTSYVSKVVVRNFSTVPPLINTPSGYAFPLQPNICQLGAGGSVDVYRHHHSHNSPAYFCNALSRRTPAHLRTATLLRELSRFGDGLGRYFPESDRVVVYVPIFSERRAAVLALPQERAYATTLGQQSSAVINAVAAGSATASSAGKMKVTTGDANGKRMEVRQQVEVQAVAELQVRVRVDFIRTTSAAESRSTSTDGKTDDGVYSTPPRVYLVDAAAPRGPQMAAPLSLTARCFNKLLENRETGEVMPSAIQLSAESWATQGSLFFFLVELQKVLRGCLEAFALSYTGRSPAMVLSPVQLQPSMSDAGGSGGGRDQGATGSPAPSPLDNFFASPTTLRPNDITTIGGGGSSGGESRAVHAPVEDLKSSAGHCLYCFQEPQTRTLLQPCGHDGLCGLCVQRLQSHCREEAFPCPVCRETVYEVMEVFL